MSTNDKSSPTRREFIRATALVLGALAAPAPASALVRLKPIVDPLAGNYPYRGWEDLYRKEWAWDSVGFTTHSNGCVAGCAWRVYVKDGVPMRDEQVAAYPQLPGIPDMNPRGCQKGAVYCSWVKQPDFLKWPLKRVGARGERKWKRISWDEALTEIADKIIDTTYEGWRLEGNTELGRVKDKPGRSVSMVLAQWVWGEQYRRTKAYYDDTQLKEQIGFGVDDMEALRKESEAKGWMPKWQSIKEPVVYINGGINLFATSVGYQHLAENFLKRCELLVVVDFRLNSGAMYADIVLPAAPEQQKLDIRETSVTRFIHAFGQPVKPMYERKTDWQINVALAKKIQERAKARGVTRVEDPEIKSAIDFNTIYDDFTMNGTVEMDEAALRFVMEKSKALGSGTYEELMKNGFVAVGPSAGKTAPLPKDKPYRPFTVNVTDKKPYGTLTGRLQFYVDHDWYQRFDATVPKPQVKGGHLGPKRFPFKTNSPHTRWGIHSWCRNEQWLLRHQRGEPDVCLNPKAMARKGIKDGDMVRVFNDIGEFFAVAKPWPALPEDQVFSEHGWEQYLYNKMTHYNMINAELINPLELVGGYGHIRYASGGFNPNRIFYETTVDIEKVKE